jgi:hypothetical protein
VGGATIQSDGKVILIFNMPAPAVASFGNHKKMSAYNWKSARTGQIEQITRI